MSDDRRSGTEEWTVLESATEYETGWFTGGYDLVEQPDGSTKRYYWAELAPAVVVVGIAGDERDAAGDDPVDAANDDAGDEPRVVFVEQYRPTIRESQLELVAGIVDEHDGGPAEPVDPADYEAAARRELREETGYRADDVTLLESFAVCTGLLRHRRGIVVATGLASGEPDLDDSEFLTARTEPATVALDRAREPPTNDATLEGLLLAADDGYLD